MVSLSIHIHRYSTFKFLGLGKNTDELAQYRVSPGILGPCQYRQRQRLWAQWRVETHRDWFQRCPVHLLRPLYYLWGNFGECCKFCKHDLPRQIPSNLLLKYIKPHIFLSVCMFLFGLVSVLQGLVTTKGQLICTRFFLGFFETGVFPGCFYICKPFGTSIHKSSSKRES